MFGSKKCSHCNRKIKKDFEFCPYCSSPIDNKKDYGMLGKSDDLRELDEKLGRSFSSSGIGSSIFEKMIASTMKMIEKEMQKSMMDNKMPKQMPNKINQNPNLKTNFELFINGKKVNLPGNIAGIQIEEVNGIPNMNSQNQPQKKLKAKMPKVSEEILEKSAKLPRKEAKSKVSRNSEKVIYELETPGLESVHNVLINQLENSLEVKAYTDKAVYFKNLKVKLQLLQYSLREGKLFLEFKA